MSSIPVQSSSYPVRPSFPSAQAPAHVVDIESAASAADVAEASQPALIAGWTQRAAAALPQPFARRAAGEAVHPVGGLSNSNTSGGAGSGCAKGAAIGAVFGVLGVIAFGVAGGVLRDDENRRRLGERLLEIGVPVSFVVPIILGSLIGSCAGSRS